MANSTKVNVNGKNWTLTVAEPPKKNFYKTTKKKFEELVEKHTDGNWVYSPFQEIDYDKYGSRVIANMTLYYLTDKDTSYEHHIGTWQSGKGWLVH